MQAVQLVSVVTPSFNQGRFIEETLSSVALQDYRPVEQIVIDGGSTDNTVEILKRWSRNAQYPGYSFEWASEPDRGHGDALNKGFARARGDIVGWLNSDDVYFDRHTIARAVAALAKRPDVDVVYGDVALISETSGLWMVWCFPEFKYDRALRGYIIPQPTTFFRRCVIEKHRIDPGLKVALDYAYWLQIGRDCRFHHVGRVQAGDRDHGDRQTHVNRALWRNAEEELRRSHGAPTKPGFFAKSGDTLVRLSMRVKGLIHLVCILGHKGLQENLAFPMWIDSPQRLMMRQLTMRLGNRPDLGARPDHGGRTQ